VHYKTFAALAAECVYGALTPRTHTPSVTKWVTDGTVMAKDTQVKDIAVAATVTRDMLSYSCMDLVSPHMAWRNGSGHSGARHLEQLSVSLELLI
jgi:hypothetical protein